MIFYRIFVKTDLLSCILINVFLIGIGLQNASCASEVLRRVLDDGPSYVPPGYVEEVTTTLGPLKYLPKCEEDGDSKKVCVSYYRCDADTKTVIPENATTSGPDVINIREEESECDSYLEVCCNAAQEAPMNISTPPVPSGEPSGLKPTFCGIRNEQGLGFKISGQTDEAEYGEFPWMVAILKTNFDRHVDPNQLLCGASLIAPSVVMTAAHCVHNYTENPNQIKIRAGEWDSLTEKERLPHQERNVKQIIVHDQFNPSSLINDVALLVLDEALVEADNIGTICLPSFDEVFQSEECFASGWGKKGFGNAERYSAILKKHQLPLIPKDECQTALRKTRVGQHVLDDLFVCAGGQHGIDTCTGDDGSPLVCPDPNKRGRYVQVGIVSWGVGCGEEDFPGLYVNVASFRNWTDLHMEMLNFGTKPYTS